MKQKLLLVICFTTITILTNAQAPNAIPYQAVARGNTGDAIANQNISMRFTIHDGSPTGTIVYQETQSVTTNAGGMFNANIGQGVIIFGSFAIINWGGGSKFIQIEMDIMGGSSYTNMGTQQMLSVPYALYSANDGKWTSNGSDIYNLNTGKVGVGTNVPPVKLTVYGIPSSPAIPGGTSSALFRIASSDIEGIDFGKAGSPTYAGWIQSGFDGTVADPLTLQPVGGNVGIGINSPAAKLDVAGKTKTINFQMTTGAGVNKILQSDASGNASWTASAPSPCGYAIGQNNASLGGFIFYLDASGCHGLVAAPADQSTGLQWYNGTYTNTTAFGSCVGCGFGNSSMIVFNQAGTHSNYASGLCYDLAFGILDDWYLPSEYELNLMYANIGQGAAAPNTNIGGFAGLLYWSSSEKQIDVALTLFFGDGSPAYNPKHANLRVRAIRAF